MFKKFICILPMLVLCVHVSDAKTYVSYDKSSNEVLFVSDKDDVVLSENDVGRIETLILPNDVEFYNMTEEYSNYKVQGNHILLNMDKINKEESEKKALEDLQSEQALINEKLKEIAIDALEADGIKLKYINKK